MVGMGMCFQQPVYCQATLANESDDGICPRRACTAGFGVVVQHRVNHGAFSLAGLEYHVRECSRLLIEKRLDLRCWHSVSVLTVIVARRPILTRDARPCAPGVMQR